MVGMVLAVAAMGGAAAGFTDELTVNGSVNTATMDFEVIGWSETWVYSYLAEDEEQFLVRNEPADPTLFPPDEYTLVGSADVDGQEPGMLQYPDTETKEMSIIITGIMPGIDFTASVFIRYTGSIPAHLHLDDFVWDYGEELQGLVTTSFNPQPAPARSLTMLVVVPEEVQLHEGDLLEIMLTARMDEPTGDGDVTSGAFSTAILLEQWNE